MRIIFDHGAPSGIAASLVAHEITEAIERGWDEISNGELLKRAEEAGFDLLLTTDKRIRYQQNLTGRNISIVVLGNSAGRFVRLYLDRIAHAVNAATSGSYAEVEIPLPPRSRAYIHNSNFVSARLRRRWHFDEVIASRGRRVGLGCYLCLVMAHNRPDVGPGQDQSKLATRQVLLIADVLIGRNHHVETLRPRPFLVVRHFQVV